VRKSLLPDAVEAEPAPILGAGSRVRGLEGRLNQPSATHPQATLTMFALIIIYDSSPAAGRSPLWMIAVAVDARCGLRVLLIIQRAGCGGYDTAGTDRD
jgi:hypothetical protein